MTTKTTKSVVNSKASVLKAIREANKETKSLSGVVKIIRAFWKDGYKESFEHIGLTFKDIEVPTFKQLWANEYKDANGNYLYPTKRAKKDENGEFILKDGKRVYENILKEYDNNFTVMRVFNALYQGKVERGEIKL